MKPKEGEVTSKPWHWPINYQVRECFLYDATKVIASVGMVISHMMFKSLV
jgi:hypothetical protein